MNEKISKIISNYKNQKLLDEDEFEVEMETTNPASDSQISEFEKKHDKLPIQYKELLYLTNGVDLFGVEIQSLEEVEYYPEYNAFSFHNWGNGDFDLITTSGEIYFLDNESEQLIPVTNSLSDWMESVILEIKNMGTIGHPYDYSFSENKGLYYSVYKRLIS